MRRCIGAMWSNRPKLKKGVCGAGSFADAISRSVPLRSGTGDTEYLRQLSRNLSAALGEFSADIIIYNAGTDCLEGDPLGLLSLTAAVS